MSASANQDTGLWALRYLRKQLRVLRDQWSLLRGGGDIGSVHDVRVAGRRARAAMRILRDRLPGKKARRWRRAIRRLTRGLGEARDRDVKIEFASSFLADLKDRALRPGVSRLLVRLEQRRQAIQPRIVRLLDRLADAGAISEMRKWTKRKLVDEPTVPEQAAAPPVGAEAILPRLAKLLAHEPCLADADAARSHHKMRIAVKRLRYSMEMFAPAYEGRLDSGLAAVKHVQTLLGDMHDCDVWAEFLAEFRDTEQARTEEYFGEARPFRRLEAGIECVRADRLACRGELFEQLGDFWRDLARLGFWRVLADVVTGRAQTLVPVESILPPEADALVAEAVADTTETSTTDGAPDSPAAAAPGPPADGAETPPADGNAAPPAEPRAADALPPHPPTLPLPLAPGGPPADLPAGDAAQ